jgi:hypothetical protein
MGHHPSCTCPYLAGTRTIANAGDLAPRSARKAHPRQPRNERVRGPSGAAAVLVVVRAQRSLGVMAIVADPQRESAPIGADGRYRRCRSSSRRSGSGPVEGDRKIWNDYAGAPARRNRFHPGWACVWRLEEYGEGWSAFARRLGSLSPRKVSRVAASFDRVSPNGTSMRVERRTFLVGDHRGA